MELREGLLDLDGPAIVSSVDPHVRLLLTELSGSASSREELSGTHLLTEPDEATSVKSEEVVDDQVVERFEGNSSTRKMMGMKGGKDVVEKLRSGHRNIYKEEVGTIEDFLKCLHHYSNYLIEN